MLAIIIARVKENGQFKGVVPHLVEEGLSILQYADDTMLFLDHDINNAMNMKLLLCTFEQLSDVKINFDKSEIFCFVQAKHCEMQFSQLFGCKTTTHIPFRYLDLPMHYRKPNTMMRMELQKRIKKFLQLEIKNWEGACVGDIQFTMFMLSFF
jgi:hypothetical protein